MPVGFADSFHTPALCRPAEAAGKLGYVIAAGPIVRYVTSAPSKKLASGAYDNRPKFFMHRQIWGDLIAVAFFVVLGAIILICALL